MNAENIKRLNAFEMWILLRQMWSTSRMARITNMERNRIKVTLLDDIPENEKIVNTKSIKDYFYR